MNALLRVDTLSITQGQRRLVQDMDLTIHAGECWMVIGPNGCGKTTLLKTLAGLLSTRHGHIALQAGLALDELDPRERARRIGLVFQHGNPGLHNSALELVMSGHHPHRRHWWDTREELASAKHALQQVGLEQQAGQNAQTLSGGELRRAEIARLLVQNPSLAMLDEPFNHLDIGQQVAMLHLLKRQFIRDDKALLIVAHDLNMAAQAASHCLLLHGDGSWNAGPFRDVADIDVLSRVFHHPLQEYRGPGGPLWGVSWE